MRAYSAELIDRLTDFIQLSRQVAVKPLGRVGYFCQLLQRVL